MSINYSCFLLSCPGLKPGLTHGDAPDELPSISVGGDDEDSY